MSKDAISREISHVRFMDLCNEGKHAEVKERLESGEIDSNFVDYDSRTALHIAAGQNFVAICDLLIKHGAKVNPIDNWGKTPFECTTSAELKNILLSCGAIDTEKDNNSSNNYKLLVYTQRGDIENVIQCIRGDVEAPKFSDYNKRTALHVACTMGKDVHYRIAGILLTNGADPNALDDFGHTPLDNAKHGNYEKFIKLIEDHFQKENEIKSTEDKTKKGKVPYFNSRVAKPPKPDRSGGS